MATMNPVNLYSDPALDDLIAHPSQSYHNTSGKERNGEHPARSVSEGYTTNGNGRAPPAPETHAQGPPITYRTNSVKKDSGLQRSFSQRAKGRPFAEEAFADDDDMMNDMRIENIPQKTARPFVADNRGQTSTTVTGQRETAQPTRSQSQRQGEVSSSATQEQQRMAATQDSQPRTPSNKAVYNRATTLRDASNQTDDDRRDWAHDRSPLQKLEVKLTDISKEEKRARVQEAEMKLMNSRKVPVREDRTSGSKGIAQPGRVPSQRQAATTVSSSKTKGDGPTRNRASEARFQDQAPLPYEVPRSSVRRSLDAEPGRSDPKSLPTLTGFDPQAQSKVRQGPSSHDTKPRSTVRSTSARQPPTHYMVDESQPQVARAVSLQQAKPQVRSQHVEPPISERDRNASHQAALEKLTGAGPEISRTGSRKLQKTPPQPKARSQKVQNDARGGSPVPVDLSVVSGGDPKIGFPQQTTAREIQVRNPQIQRDQQNLGLGLQHPKAMRSIDSPPVSLTDANKQRNRKSSVSFKEPFERRRPVDEWKQAETAQLTLDDFSSDQVEATESNKAWWEENKKTKRSSRARTTSGTAQPGQSIDDRTAQFSPPLYIKCGPLLRYAGLKRTTNEARGGAAAKEFWRGSIMIVTQDSQCSYETMPTLRLFSQPRRILPHPPSHVTAEDLAPEYVDPIAGLIKLGRTGRARYVRPVDHLDEEKDLSRIEDDNGIYEASPSPLDVNGSKDATAAANNKRTLDIDGERLGRYKEIRGARIYADPDRDVTFWRFNIEIELGPEQQHVAYRINKGAAVGFWVPAKGQTMNMMFHTCNGFSLSVNSDQFSGPDPLWRDVLNTHQTRPFHVMIGGGDQIYNDRVMTETQHFAEWTAIRNPHHKHQAPFTVEMREELETFYLERYSMWFSQGLFAMANASIPMINVWDDHDIIDGFGSYPHEFMRTPVFSGVGNIAYKYYMLFQHQSIDAMTEKDEPSWLLGRTPGPYIHARSRSLYMELGQSVAFLGVDCRTERTKNDVLSIDTLEDILERCRRDMVEGTTKHLIVLLGIPIAYPRLVWLENVLTSKAMDPIKALGRAGILKTKMLNKFDGGVEILDDLDDHWTASHHKDERNILIQELQDLAAEKSARITILGGDVHLAAIGQFYSNPKLKIPKDRDHRYMPNIISSAIVNTPPPEFMADVMNKRNKVHHLDKYTDENMIPMFTHDVDHKKRNNNCLLPRRNWCSIREYRPGETPPPSPPSSPSIDEKEGSVPREVEEEWYLNNPPKRRSSFSKNDFNPRNLMRRLSSRGQVPPTSYKTNADEDRPQQTRAFSFDGNDTSQPSQHTLQRPSSLRNSSADHINGSQDFRPTFHRRPTNLSEKAAKKGNVLAIDADGNEFDINDHVNLEGGLDISINCEINQKDPAGITTSYRILIPALWYDGSSDREKINEGAPIGRKNTVLQRLGIGSKRGNNVADRQGAGNWGQDMSETESYSGSEQVEQKPRRTFSLFGSKRKKQLPPGDNYQDSRVAQPPPNQPSHQPFIDRQLHQDENNAPAKHQNSNSMQQAGEYSDHLHGMAATQQPRSDQHGYQQEDARTSRAIPAEQIRSNSGSQQHNRPLSYTIGGSNSTNTPQESYDADAAYLRQHRKELDKPSQPRDLGYFPPPRQESSHTQSQPTGLQRTPSKQERVLGIGSAADTGFQRPQPQQTQLRGNGIIGRNVSSASNTGPSAFHNQSYGSNDDSRYNEGDNNNNAPRGYSGIEAYKEPKSRRRWSLSIREKARGLFSGMEGKRRDEGDDWYSDEEEEEYWEGPQQQQQGQHGHHGRDEYQGNDYHSGGGSGAQPHQQRRF